MVLSCGASFREEGALSLWQRQREEVSVISVEPTPRSVILSAIFCIPDKMFTRSDGTANICSLSPEMTLDTKHGNETEPA